MFAEEVSFSFLFEGSLNDASAGAADTASVSECDIEGITGRVLMNGEDIGNAGTLSESTADEMAWPLRGDHKYVDVGRGDNLIEMDIKAVSKSDSRARLEIRFNIGEEDVGLFFVGDKNHGDIGGFNGVGDGSDVETGGFNLVNGFGSGIKPDGDIESGIVQV